MEFDCELLYINLESSILDYEIMLVSQCNFYYLITLHYDNYNIITAHKVSRLIKFIY